MADESTEPAKAAQLSQLAYKPTPYAEQRWEVIGQIDENPIFEPMEIEVFSSSEEVTDPMFADYGGVRRDGEAKRLHQPANVSTGRKSEKDIKAVEAELAKKHKFTDEELAALIKRAEESGLAQAQVALAEQQNTKLASIEKRIVAVIQDIGRQLSDNIANIEREAAQLAVEISGKIFGQTIEINPEYIIQVIDEAVQKAGSASISKIRISPEDMEFINIVGISKKLKEFDNKWVFEADQTIRAGCVIDTSAGEVDFQLDKAWERIKDGVIKALR